MESDFGIVYRHKKYHDAANALPILPIKASEKGKRITDVHDDSLVYCIVGQISKLNIVRVEKLDKVGPLTSINELIEARANDMLCQNLNVVLKMDETITVNKNGLLCKKSAH